MKNKMVASTAILQALRRGDQPWSEKVKIVLHTLLNESITLPRKEQTLVDVLCNALVGVKKQLPEDDQRELWRCLARILRSPRLSKANLQLHMKASMIPCLLDGLTKCVELNDWPTEVMIVVLESEALMTVLTNRIDSMMEVLAVVAGLIVDRPEASRLDGLLTLLLRRLLTAMRRHHNQRLVSSVFVEKALVPCVRLFRHEHETRTGLLMSVVSAALLQSEHESMYKSWLQNKFNPKPGVDIKLGDQIFAALEKLSPSDAAAEFVPRFQESFVKEYPRKNDDDVMNFQLFKHLYNTMTSERVAMATVGRLLATFQSYYDVRVDHVTDGRQLAFLKTVAADILLYEVDERNSAWSDCLVRLNEMNYEILTPHFMSLWRKLFSHSAEPCVAESRLIRDLLHKYEVLRQFPKYLAKLLDVITDVENFRWPQDFQDTFSAVITRLTYGQVVDVWEALLDRTKQLHENSNVQWLSVSAMLYLTLQNIKLLDSSAPQHVRERHRQLELSTWNLTDDVDGVQSRTNPDGTSWRSSVCRLATALCNLYLIRRLYAVDDNSNGREEEEAGADDVTDDRVATLLLRAAEPGDVIGAFDHDEMTRFKIRLALQKLTLETFENRADAVLDVSVMEVIVSRIDEYRANQNAWSGHVTQLGHDESPITDQSVTYIAEWAEICNHFPTVLSHMRDEWKTTMISLLIEKACDFRASNHDAKSTSISQLSRDVCTNRDIAEMTSLQQLLVAGLWQKIYKSVNFSKEHRKMVTSLISHQTSDPGPMLRVLLQDRLEDCDVNVDVTLRNGIEFLSSLGLEYQTQPIGQRSLVNALVLLHVCSSQRPFSAALVETMTSLCHVILRLLHTHTLYTCCRPSFVLRWVTEVHERIGDQEVTRSFQTLEKLVLNILNRLLQSAIKHQILTEDLEEFSAQIDAMLKNSAASPLVMDRLSPLVRALCRVHRHPDQRVKDRLVELRRRAVDTVARLCSQASRFQSIPIRGQCVLLRLYDVVLQHGETDTSWLREHTQTIIAANQNDELYKSALIAARYICLGPSKPEQTYLKSLLTTLARAKPKVTTKRKRKYSNSSDSETPLKRPRSEEGCEREHERIVDPDESDSTLNKICRENATSGNRIEPVAVRKTTCDWFYRDGEDLLRTVIGALDLVHYAECLVEVLNDLDLRHLASTERILSSAHIWRMVIERVPELADDHKTITVQATRRVLRNMLNMEAELSRSSHEDKTRITQSLLRTRTAILEHMNDDMASSTVAMSYQSCQYALAGLSVSNTTTTLTSPSAEAFPVVFGECYKMANTLLVKYTAVVMDTLPAFLSLVQVMVEVLLNHCERSRHSTDTKPISMTSADCVVRTLFVDRIVTSLCGHKDEMSKVAPYILSSFVTDLHHANTDRSVMRCLEAGVHELLSVCTEHGIALLYTTLTTGPKILFKQLHNDYIKFHKYTGSV